MGKFSDSGSKLYTEAFRGKDLEHQNLPLTSTLRNKVFFSATSMLSQRQNPMARNSTASLDKVTCTNNVDVGKNQSTFAKLFVPEKIPTIRCKT